MRKKKPLSKRALRSSTQFSDRALGWQVLNWSADQRLLRRYKRTFPLFHAVLSAVPPDLLRGLTKEELESKRVLRLCLRSFLYGALLVADRARRESLFDEVVRAHPMLKDIVEELCEGARGYRLTLRYFFAGEMDFNEEDE